MMRATPILERNHFHLDTALYSHAFFLVIDETWELMARSRFSVSKPMICVLFGPPIQRTSFLAGITRDLRMFSRQARAYNCYKCASCLAPK